MWDHRTVLGGTNKASGGIVYTNCLSSAKASFAVGRLAGFFDFMVKNSSSISRIPVWK